jgi:hypothetical protein
MNEGTVWKIRRGNSEPYVLSMMRTTTGAESRRAAAILSVMEFVDATTNTIPQTADSRSAVDMNLLASFLSITGQ